MVKIQPQDLVYLIEGGKFKNKILDVRNANEWAQGVVDGAILLNLNQLNTQAEKVLDHNSVYYVHCKGGMRSMMAYGLLKKKGFNIINIVGGYDGLVKSGLKSIKMIK